MDNVEESFEWQGEEKWKQFPAKKEQTFEAGREGRQKSFPMVFEEGCEEAK